MQNQAHAEITSGPIFGWRDVPAVAFSGYAEERRAQISPGMVQPHAPRSGPRCEWRVGRRLGER